MPIGVESNESFGDHNLKPYVWLVWEVEYKTLNNLSYGLDNCSYISIILNLWVLHLGEGFEFTNRILIYLCRNAFILIMLDEIGWCRCVIEALNLHHIFVGLRFLSKIGLSFIRPSHLRYG